MSAKTSMKIKPNQIAPSELDIVNKAVNDLNPGSDLSVFLESVVDATHRGATITTLIQDKELTPNQAAEALGMSRPHLLKFIRSGALKHHLVGAHQRISYEDFLDFQTRYEAAAKDVAKALATNPRTSRQITLTDDEMAELDAL